jgi:hypothetical protein
MHATAHSTAQRTARLSCLCFGFLPVSRYTGSEAASRRIVFAADSGPGKMTQYSYIALASCMESYHAGDTSTTLLYQSSHHLYDMHSYLSLSYYRDGAWVEDQEGAGTAQLELRRGEQFRETWSAPASRRNASPP